MNTKKTAITLIAAMMVLAMITTAVMAAICDEPCGTKIEQCTNNTATKDAVYALVIPGVTPGVPAMALAFEDADSSGAFEDGECVYIDTDAGVVLPPAQNYVESGDIRLCGSCGSNPNTPVMACDNEIGHTLTYPPRPQAFVGYVDVDLSGYYDITEPLYLDMDGSSSITLNDIRLTGFMGYDPYTVVKMVGGVPDADYDMASPMPLNDLVVQGGAIVTDMNDLLGFVDTSCDNMWDNRTTLGNAGQPVATGEDKLYLQQPVLVNPNTARILDPFEDFVTIGDFRLYMPPNETCWFECGTKVQQCDLDATYPLLIPGSDITLAQGPVPGMLIRWVDVNSNGVFEGSVDHVYIDTDGVGPTVQAGDIRLTAACGCAPNTVVGVCSQCDMDDTYAPPMPQTVVGYVDVGARAGVYDLGDPLYLDTSAINGVGVGVVSGNDIRLTERTVGGTTYLNWTVVKSGDKDTYINPVGLNDLMAPHGAPVTPINTLLGFVDSNCDGRWASDGTDKLYLQQIVFPLVAPGIPGINQFDRFTTIGDFRMYMPNETCWPECGTKVVECDIDETGALLRPMHDTPTQDGAIPQMAIATSASGCVYIDVNINTGNAEVEVGDVRLSKCCEDMEPNTVVKSCDCDYGTPLNYPPANSLLGYVDDPNNNNIYDINDPLYLDLDQNGPGADGFVSPGDLRLTERTSVNPLWQRFAPYTIVKVGDWDEDSSAVGNTLRCPKNNIPLTVTTPCMNVNYYLGFRDSGCTGLWDGLGGGDELYLQQMVPEAFGVNVQEPQFNMFSTIGDFRIYMPANETASHPGPCEVYDTNGTPGIQKDEAVNAINDYLFAGTINKATAVAVVNCYLFP